MTTALQVANYIKNEKFLHGAMQLQKLLYYSQAWSLAWTGKSLFADEIEAWKMGPVVRDVWVWDKFSPTTAHLDPLSAEAKEIVDAVYRFYGSNGGAALSEMTHKELPWVETRGNLPADASCTDPISHATMRRFFTKLSMDSASVPSRPIASRAATNDAVRDAGSTQRARWRSALDELAFV